MERIASLLSIALVLAACGQGEARADRDGSSAARPTTGSAAVSGAADDTTRATGAGADRGDGAVSGEAPDGRPGAAPSTASTPDGATPRPPATPTSASPARETPGTSGAGSPSDEETRAPRPVDASRQEEILRATSRAYEGLRSFRATFEQTLDNTLLGRTTRSEGTLFQRQPDRFLMRFTDPAGDVIVSDGQYFWMYFPSVDAKQVIRTRRGGQGLDLRSQFIGDPVRRFEATSHGTEAVRGREAHVMTLVPREQLGYQRLKVWIDARDHLVRRFELTENNGNIRRFVLSDLATNPSLPDDLFQFTPPAGAQVVER